MANAQTPSKPPPKADDSTVAVLNSLLLSLVNRVTMENAPKQQILAKTN
jgi:hypothetical protein